MDEAKARSRGWVTLEEAAGFRLHAFEDCDHSEGAEPWQRFVAMQDRSRTNCAKCRARLAEQEAP